MQFSGYKRADGSAGIRNYVLVIPGGFIGSQICDIVEGTRTINLIPDTFLGHTSRDRETIGRTLIGLGLNPNVHSVIVDNSAFGADYPQYTPARLIEEIAASGKRVEFLDVKKEGGTFKALARGIELARDMTYEASKVRRQPFDIGALTLGVKCGISDTTSGIAGNPVIGNLYDRVVNAGGTALFGENTEIIGAEEVLAGRGANEEVSRQILHAAKTIEDVAKSTGEDIRSLNPMPENIAGGISSLEEKSLGAICKSGSAPIQGVLRYGERPPAKGLYFCDVKPQFNCLISFAASGAQLLLFQLGGGGAYRGAADILLPAWLGVVAPLMWTTANPAAVTAAHNSIDFYSGTVLEGKDSVEEAGAKLLKLVLDTASGTFTRVESIKYGEPAHFGCIDTDF